MDVRNCRQCGRLFNYIGGPQVCPACKDKLEDKFQEVKEFIRDNPRASIQEVSEENDVSVQQIRQWVREERLEFSADSPVGIECEKCGASIRTGRFCEACKNNVADAFRQSIAPPPPKVDLSAKKKDKDKEHMRFL